MVKLPEDLTGSNSRGSYKRSSSGIQETAKPAAISSSTSGLVSATNQLPCSYISGDYVVHLSFGTFSGTDLERGVAGPQRYQTRSADICEVFIYMEIAPAAQVRCDFISRGRWKPSV